MLTVNCAAFVPVIAADGVENVTLPKVMVTVTACSPLARGGPGGVPGTKGIPKVNAAGVCVTPCACAGSASNNKSGLHATKNASFFILGTAVRTSFIRPSFGRNVNLTCRPGMSEFCFITKDAVLRTCAPVVRNPEILTVRNGSVKKIRPKNTAFCG